MHKTTETAVWELTTTIRRLRTEQTAIISASGTLLAWGIESATEEVIERLHAIKAEAQVISARLNALGADQQAYDAIQGWAIIPATHRDTAQAAS